MHKKLILNTKSETSRKTLAVSFLLTVTFLLILNNERHLLLSFTRSFTGSHNHSPHPFFVNNLFSFIEILWLFRFMWQQWVGEWCVVDVDSFFLPRRRIWRSKRFFLDVLRLSILSWCTHACWRCCCGFTTVEKRSWKKDERQNMCFHFIVVKLKFIWCQKSLCF